MDTVVKPCCRAWQTTNCCNITDDELRQLIRASKAAKENAYCPYSNFRVGAAVLTQDERKVFSGCNVENASYGLTVCAERNAIGSAVSQGYRSFACVMVTADIVGRFVTPCGSCRQVIAEFAPHQCVLMIQPGFTEEQYLAGEGIKQMTVEELLPAGFSAESLHLPKCATNGK